MNREQSFDSLQEPFDVLVIGGGATGLGIAVDAVTRGFRTALVEASVTIPVGVFSTYSTVTGPDA